MSKEYPHTATYSPQDDKIRLYLGFRIDKAEWTRLTKTYGFTWCMKQKEAGGCDLAAPWSVAREDVALELCGEIEDEDQPREERAAQRAERFAEYRDKREGEAHTLAARYEDRSTLHGHQNPQRAERAAARHDRIGGRAVTQWDKAEYWQHRTARVISHALYLEEPSVRHRRIKGIESDLRKEAKEHDVRVKRYNVWVKVSKIEDAEKQTAAARYVAGNAGDYWSEYQHPTDTTQKPQSMYDLLNSGVNPISGKQAAEIWLAGNSNPETWPRRWKNHLEMRLSYENQMLAAQGGTAANNTEMIAGGFVGKFQILKTSKDRAGRVSKVWLIGAGYQGSTRAKKAENIDPKSYRAPTPEELAAFKDLIKKAKDASPKALPLINPTDADAEKLQAALNAENSARWKGGTPSTVLRITSEEYKRNVQPRLRGHLTTLEVNDDGTETDQHRGESGKARVRYAIGGMLYGCNRVVILTDVPQKALPLGWVTDPWRAFKKRLRRCSCHELPRLAREVGLTPPFSEYDTDKYITFILENLPASPADVKQTATV